MNSKIIATISLSDDDALEASFQEVFEDPSDWGIAFADITRRIAKAYEALFGEHTEQEIVLQIFERFQKELERPEGKPPENVS